MFGMAGPGSGSHLLCSAPPTPYEEQCRATNDKCPYCTLQILYTVHTVHLPDTTHTKTDQTEMIDIKIDTSFMIMLMVSRFEPLCQPFVVSSSQSGPVVL